MAWTIANAPRRSSSGRSFELDANAVQIGRLGVTDGDVELRARDDVHLADHAIPAPPRQAALSSDRVSGASVRLPSR
jgi:hypothetical protein